MFKATINVWLGDEKKAVLDAAKKGDLEALKCLDRAGKNKIDFNAISDSEGNNALHLAVINFASTGVINWLLVRDSGYQRIDIESKDIMLPTI